MLTYSMYHPETLKTSGILESGGMTMPNINNNYNSSLRAIYQRGCSHPWVPSTSFIIGPQVVLLSYFVALAGLEHPHPGLKLTDPTSLCLRVLGKAMHHHA